MPREFRPIEGAVYICSCVAVCIGIGHRSGYSSILTGVIGGNVIGGNWVGQTCSCKTGTPKLLFLPTNGEHIELRCE